MNAKNLLELMSIVKIIRKISTRVSPKSFQPRVDVLKECSPFVDYNDFYTTFKKDCVDLFCVQMPFNVKSRKIFKTKEIIQKSINTETIQPYSILLILFSKLLAHNHDLSLDETHYRIGKNILLIQAFVEMHKKINENDENNKFYLLIGDIFFTEQIREAATLYNNETRYIINTSICDVISSQFIGPMDKYNNPLPGKPKSECDEFNFDINVTLPKDKNFLGNPKKEWDVRNIFNNVIILARGLQGISSHYNYWRLNNILFKFGVHFGLALQAAEELRNMSNKVFGLTSAPVLYALSENNNLYDLILKGKDDVNCIDYNELKFGIMRTDALERSKLLIDEHAREALKYIEIVEKEVNFSNGIFNLIKAMLLKIINNN